MGASGDGADITTFFAPPLICNIALSFDVKKPVHSATTSVFDLSHPIFSGFDSLVILIFLPPTIRKSFSTLISSLKRPCTESYFSKYAKCFTSSRSLIATTSTSGFCIARRKTILPILPKPLIPIFNDIFLNFKLIIYLSNEANLCSLQTLF